MKTNHHQNKTTFGEVIKYPPDKHYPAGGFVPVVIAADGAKAPLTRVDDFGERVICVCPDEEAAWLNIAEANGKLPKPPTRPPFFPAELIEVPLIHVLPHETVDGCFRVVKMHGGRTLGLFAHDPSARPAYKVWTEDAWRACNGGAKFDGMSPSAAQDDRSDAIRAIVRSALDTDGRFVEISDEPESR